MFTICRTDAKLLTQTINKKYGTLNMLCNLKANIIKKKNEDIILA